MPEQDPLRARFAAYRGDLTARIDGPGPDAARRTLRRRRRATVAAGMAVVVAVVVGPITAGAALRDGPPPAPPASTPSVDPTWSPSPGPSPSASRSPAQSASSPAAPDGRITERQLRAARPDLPAWAGRMCADTRQVTLLPADTDEVDRPYLISLAHGDVDADGATETVALLGCRLGEASAKQVVAFDRDSSGRITTLGRVTRTHEEGDGGFDDVLAITVAEGNVRVQVADIQPCCGTAPDLAREQWRAHRWNGERFTQVDGPTTFPAERPVLDLAATATDLVLGRPDDAGLRHGTATFTITNQGDVRSGHVLLAVSTSGRADRASEGWSRCRSVRVVEGGYHCLLGGLDAGGRLTVTLGFTAPAGAEAGDGTAAGFVSSDDGSVYDDADMGDNEARFAIRHTD